MKPRSPYTHVLTRSLGAEGPLVADVSPISLEPGDRVLFCCDGLTDMVPDEEIASIVSSEPEQDACCHRLIEAANAAGGEDNITVVVVDVSAAD